MGLAQGVPSANVESGFSKNWDKKSFINKKKLDFRKKIYILNMQQMRAAVGIKKSKSPLVLVSRCQQNVSQIVDVGWTACSGPKDAPRLLKQTPALRKYLHTRPSGVRAASCIPTALDLFMQRLHKK